MNGLPWLCRFSGNCGLEKRKTFLEAKEKGLLCSPMRSGSCLSMRALALPKHKQARPLPTPYTMLSNLPIPSANNNTTIDSPTDRNS